MQEIIEYIPNEGEPVLISGPKPLHPPEKQPAPKEDYLLRSMDLDNSFIEERGKGVIEDNEVLVRGEWKKGPGMDLFRTLREHISTEALIAESGRSPGKRKRKRKRKAIRCTTARVVGRT